MSKKNKKPSIISIITAAVVCLMIGASVAFHAIYMIEDGKYKKKEYFTFASREDGAESLYKDVAAIKKYESKFSDINTYTYYNTLNSREKLIYKAFEYAMDNAKSNIFILNSLMEDGDISPDDILYFLSLDTPAMDQNFSIGKTSETNTVEYDGRLGTHLVENRGITWDIEKFELERREKCELAIEKGREIAKTIPQDSTDAEKAKQIYNYMAENVTYRSAEAGTGEAFDEEHLYNALVTGFTNCDGYSNAVSLLCNLCGIPAFEKIAFKSDNDVGHTWDMIKIDGTWYNCDATDATDDVEMPVSLHFAFPDELIEYDVDYADHIPSADKYFTLPDGIISEGDTNGVCDVAAAAFTKTKRDYVFLILNFEPDNIESEMQELVDRERHDITYYRYDGNKKTGILIVKE